MQFQYVITVMYDGQLRTLDPREFSPATLEGMTHMIGRVLSGQGSVAPPVNKVEPILANSEKPPELTTTTKRYQARMQGYSGDMCDKCQSFTMKRTGTCLACETCGETSGGCS